MKHSGLTSALIFTSLCYELYDFRMWNWNFARITYLTTPVSLIDDTFQSIFAVLFFIPLDFKFTLLFTSNNTVCLWKVPFTLDTFISSQVYLIQLIYSFSHASFFIDYCSRSPTGEFTFIDSTPSESNSSHSHNKFVKYELNLDFQFLTHSRLTQINGKSEVENISRPVILQYGKAKPMRNYRVLQIWHNCLN